MLSLLSRPAFVPIVEHLRTAFGIRTSQPMTEQLQRLEQSLRELGVNLDEAVPLNAELLDITYTPPYSPLT